MLCDSCQPVQVAIEEPVVFRDVQCGVDGTMFITDMGGVFACGSNEHNKLGLNNRQGFLMAMKNIFTKVTGFGGFCSGFFLGCTDLRGGGGGECLM